MAVLAISHAWLINDDRLVIDPTWVGEKFAGATYFGVVFDEEFVMEIAEKTKRYGILDTDYLK